MKPNKRKTTYKKKEPKCDCGKTAKEHGPELPMHHYMYFHKEPMKGCVYCK